jgi:CubicO group peptidase (beta-lactamase class C family)
MRIVYNYPSVAYGVIRNDSVLVLNTVGYRDIETKEKTQTTDYYHIGSNTKAFTGFLAAKIVEDSLIQWDTKFSLHTTIPSVRTITKIYNHSNLN